MDTGGEKERGIGPSDTDLPQVLRDFVRSNSENLFELLTLKGPTSYRGLLPESLKKFTHQVKLWSQKKEIVRIAELIKYCAWKTRGIEMELTDTHLLCQVLSGDTEVDICLLKAFFYIYRSYLSSSRLATQEHFKQSFEKLEIALESYTNSICFEYNPILEERSFEIANTPNMACYFLLLSLFSKKVPPSLHTNLQQLFEEMCANRKLSEVNFSALLCMCSIHLKVVEGPLNPDFTVNGDLSAECLELMLDCLGKYRTLPDLLIRQMLSRIVDTKLKLHDESLIYFLSNGQRVHYFLDFYQSSALELRKRALFIFSRVRLSSVAFCNALDRVDFLSMTPDIFHTLSPTLELLFDKQFSSNALNLSFSTDYLNKLIAVCGFTESNIKSTLLKTVNLAISSSQSFALGLEMTRKYIVSLIEVGKTNPHLLISQISSAIAHISHLFPDLRKELLNIMITTCYELDKNVSNVSFQECENSTDCKYHLMSLRDKLFNDTTEQYSVPEDLAASINRYINELKECISNPENGFQNVNQLISDFQSKSKQIDYCNIDLALLESTEQGFEKLLYSFIAANVEQFIRHSKQAYTQNTEQFEKKQRKFVELWESHFQLVEAIFRSPLLVSLAFGFHSSPILRLFAFSEIAGVFDDMHPVSLEDNADIRFSRISRLIQRAYISGFEKPDSEEMDLFNAIISSPSLIAALRNMNLRTNDLEYFSNRIFFTDMGSDSFGVSIIGGYIILNSKNRWDEDKQRSVSAITLAHELAHMALRKLSESSSPGLEGTSRRDLFTYSKKSPSRHYTEGMPGENRNSEYHRSEGGYALEHELFGCVVSKLTDSQIQFLCDPNSWNTVLEDFKHSLSDCRHKTNGHRVRYLKRSSGGINHFDRVQSCGFHPFSS